MIMPGMMFGPGFGLLILGVIIAGLAQLWVKSTFGRFSNVRANRGVTADRVARKLLDLHGLTSVDIRPVGGHLTDHYDPRNKSIGLSESVYGNDSIAAIGVAAHEVGHAIQHSTQYSPLAIRNTLVPVVNLTSTMAMPLVIASIFLQIPALLDIGIFLFLGVVVFHLVTLPIEFNASSRAMALLGNTGTLSAQELNGAGSVLNAAALTYVAATVVAVLQLIRLLMIRGSRD